MRAVVLSLVLSVMLVGWPAGNLAAAERAAPATILVRLPADAQVTLDGQATRSQGAIRRFITPPLERGKTFHYTLEAKVTRGSEVLTSAAEVSVRAGEETSVILDLPAPATAVSGLVATPARSYSVLPGWAGPAFYRPYVPGYGSAFPAAVPYSPGITAMRQQDPLWRAGPPGTGAPYFAESGIFQP